MIEGTARLLRPHIFRGMLLEIQSWNEDQQPWHCGKFLTKFPTCPAFHSQRARALKVSCISTPLITPTTAKPMVSLWTKQIGTQNSSAEARVHGLVQGKIETGNHRFSHQIMRLSCKFSLKPIHWQRGLEDWLWLTTALTMPNPRYGGFLKWGV